MRKSEKEKIREKILDGTIYKTKKYREWRAKVFERDRYTCQLTGQTGSYIEAHHIYPKYKNPEKIFDVENGITLTGYAHKWVHREGLVEQFRRKFLKLARTNKPRKKIKKIIKKMRKSPSRKKKATKKKKRKTKKR